jgi:hypothetical protein
VLSAVTGVGVVVDPGASVPGSTPTLVSVVGEAFVAFDVICCGVPVMSVVTLALAIAVASADAAGVLANGPVLVACGDVLAGSNEYESRITGTVVCVFFLFVVVAGRVFAGAACCVTGLTCGTAGAGRSFGASRTGNHVTGTARLGSVRAGRAATIAPTVGAMYRTAIESEPIATNQKRNARVRSATSPKRSNDSPVTACAEIQLPLTLSATHPPARRHVPLNSTHPRTGLRKRQ